MIAANNEEAVPVAPSTGAKVPSPILSALPWVALSSPAFPPLTTVVVSMQRIELFRLLKHPAFTNEQRSTATCRIMAEKNPARLGRWLTNLMRQITDWENHILATEEGQHILG